MMKAQRLLHSLFLWSSALGKVLGKFHVELYNFFAFHTREIGRPGKQTWRDSATQAPESNRVRRSEAGAKRVALPREIFEKLCRSSKAHVMVPEFPKIL